MTPSSKRALLIIFLIVFIDLLGFGVVLPLLPRYARELNAGPATLGLLMASFSAMQFLFAPVWGRISDRVGRRPILLIGLAGSVLFYGLFGYASLVKSLAIMFVSRIGAGMAGATISIAQAYIADSTPPERRTAGMALIGAAFGAGFTFGPLLAALALTLSPAPADVSAGNPTRAASVEAAPSVATTADVAQTGERSSLSPMVGFLAAGLSAVALLLAIVMLPESLQPGRRTRAFHWFDMHSLRTAVAVPAIGSLILVFFVATLGFAMFESTLALLSRDAFGLPDVKNLYLFTYTGLNLALAQGVIVRPLSKRITDAPLCLSGILLSVLGMLGLAAVCFYRSWTLLLATLTVVVMGFSLVAPAVQAMISKRSRTDQQGGILGLNQSGSALARILGPFLGIVLYGEHGATMTYPYWTGALLIGATFFLVLRIRKAPVATDEDEG